jgi:hypothetical protein
VIGFPLDSLGRDERAFEIWEQKTDKCLNALTYKRF